MSDFTKTYAVIRIVNLLINVYLKKEIIDLEIAFYFGIESHKNVRIMHICKLQIVRCYVNGYTIPLCSKITELFKNLLKLRFSETLTAKPTKKTIYNSLSQIFEKRGGARIFQN